MKKLIQIIILLSFIALCSCESDVKSKNSTDIDDSEAKEKTTNEIKSTAGSLSWEYIPVYPGAVLETKTNCTAKWADCEKCEHRIYATSNDPDDVCSFYKDAMENKGWKRIVFQVYPEGSCMGSWLSADSETRFFQCSSKKK